VARDGRWDLEVREGSLQFKFSTDGHQCDGTYTTSGGTTRVTAACTQSDGGDSGSVTMTFVLAHDKDVARLWNADSYACLVRVGSAADKRNPGESTDPQCSQLLDQADPGRGARSDLRNALTAEKTYYTDNQAYTDKVSDLKAIEPSLDWGGKLKVVVGDAIYSGDNATVCLSEAATSGTPTFELADVSAGAKAGTFYGKLAAGCPANDGSGTNLNALDASW